MPSTFTSNTGIEKIADGEQSGLWGQTTNLNFDIIDRALNGVGSVSLSGTTHTLTTSSGGLSDGQFNVLVFTGSPSGTNTVTIAPNTAQKTYWVRNTTSQTVVMSQGTGATVSVPGGTTKVVASNGAGIGASVLDLTDVLGSPVLGNLTAVGALNINTANGNYFTKTVSTNSTFTFSGAPAARSYSFTLEINHVAGSITWPAEVEFTRGQAPTLTAGKVHLFVFVTSNGGATWRGAALTNYET